MFICYVCFGWISRWDLWWSINLLLISLDYLISKSIYNYRDVEVYNDWITYNNIPNQTTHCSCYYNHAIYLKDDDTQHYNRNYVSLQLFSLESSQLNNHLNKYTFRFPRTFLFKTGSYKKLHNLIPLLSFVFSFS